MLLLSIGMVPAALADSRPPDQKSLVATILARWRARTEYFKTIKVEWKNEEKFLPEIYPPTVEKRLKSHEAHKERLVSLPSDISLVLDGRKMSLVSVVAGVDAQRVSVSPRHHYVFDGQKAYEFQEHPTQTRGEGTINMEPYKLFPRIVYFSAAYTVFRTTDRELRHFVDNPDQFKVVEQNVPIDDSSCLLVEETCLEGPFRRRRYYVDPQRDFAILRAENYMQTRLYQRMEFAYRKDDTHGYLPTSWKCSCYFGFKDPQTKLETPMLASGSTSTVTLCQINQPVAAETFDLAFPAGTIVNAGGKTRSVEFTARGGLARNEVVPEYPVVVASQSADSAFSKFSFRSRVAGVLIAVSLSGFCVLAIRAAWQRRRVSR